MRMGLAPRIRLSTARRPTISAYLFPTNPECIPFSPLPDTAQIYHAQYFSAVTIEARAAIDVSRGMQDVSTSLFSKPHPRGDS